MLARRRRPDAPPASSVASAITARSCSSSGRSRLNQVPPSRTRCASPLASAREQLREVDLLAVDRHLDVEAEPVPRSVVRVRHGQCHVGAASLYR